MSLSENVRPKFEEGAIVFDTRSKEVFNYIHKRDFIVAAVPNALRLATDEEKKNLTPPQDLLQVLEKKK